MRVKFSDVHDVRSDRIAPHVPVTIGDMIMGRGITSGAAICSGGIVLGPTANHDLEERARVAVAIVEVH